MTKSKKKIHSKYQEYLKKREGEVKERTLYLLERVFRTFPPPSQLNGDYFRSLELASSTLQHYITTAKHFLKWSGLSKEEIDKLIDFKPKKADAAVTVEDLYTSEELKKIINATMNTRDRAIIEVLYETAARARELLSMTVENIRFNGDIAHVIVKGKTGTREIPIYESVPSLRAWLNVHPMGKGPVWVSMNEPFAPVKYAGLYRLVELSIKRSGLTDKKRILHLFRHTRLTEMYTKGFRGQSLKKIAGWTDASNMESVYVKLSSGDVENEAKSKLFGLEDSKEETHDLLKSSSCISCGAQNPQGSYICSECNAPLTEDKIREALQRSQDADTTKERLEYLEEKLERLARFQDTIGEKMLVNIGTDKEPIWVEGYFTKAKRP